MGEFKMTVQKNRRDTGKVAMILVNSVLPVLLAFAIGAVIIALVGENPFYTYGQMISKSLFDAEGLMRTLHVAGPLILTGLAIAVTFKAGIFNMGVEGQMLLGGFFAGILGSSITGLPPALHVTVCLLAGVFCGMAFALIPAILKAYFKVNEMVVTLMLNYAMTEVLTFMAEGVFRDQKAGYVATPMIQNSAMFNKLGGTDITLFFFIAIAVFVIILFVMKRGKLGYEINAIGKNLEFAEATGMKVRTKIVVIMLLSGALSGLAGAGWMMSERFRYTLSFSGSPGLGWDGMLISLLGMHDPIGVIVAAFFYGALKVGMSKIELFTEVPKEIVSVIQALMILFLSIQYLTKSGAFDRLLRRKEAN
jgi:simple sugar transport system permease protein